MSTDKPVSQDTFVLQKLDSLEGKLNSVVTQLTHMNATLEAQDHPKRIDELENKVEQQDRRILKLETRLAPVFAALGALGAGLVTALAALFITHSNN